MSLDGHIDCEATYTPGVVRVLKRKPKRPSVFITPEKRAKALEMLRYGRTGREVSAALGFSNTTIVRIRRGA